jgi:hypothetical protein
VNLKTFRDVVVAQYEEREESCTMKTEWLFRVSILIVLLTRVMSAENDAQGGADGVGRQADQGATVPAADSPARWLRVPEHGESWMRSTENCRRLLDRLDLKSTLVQNYLPTVKQKVSLLTRTTAFDWRRQTAIDYLENTLDDLIAG